MTRSPRRFSSQTSAVIAALAVTPSQWCYGLEIAAQTGLKSGSLYPILIRLHERGLLESRWLEPTRQGRPARHAYRLTAAGCEAARALHAPTDAIPAAVATS